MSTARFPCQWNTLFYSWGSSGNFPLSLPPSSCLLLSRSFSVSVYFRSCQDFFKSPQSKKKRGKNTVPTTSWPSTLHEASHWTGDFIVFSITRRWPHRTPTFGYSLSRGQLFTEGMKLPLLFAFHSSFLSSFFGMISVVRSSTYSMILFFSFYFFIFLALFRRRSCYQYSYYHHWYHYRYCHHH